jgi:hypothetical protein
MSNLSTHDLIEACREPGCPICRLEQRHVQRYLEHQFYENVNDVDYRHLLRQSMGFCREHTWQIVDERLGDVLGIAILHHDLIGTTLEKLGKTDPSVTDEGDGRKKQLPGQVSAIAQRALSAITPHKRCPACHQRDEEETSLVSSLMENIGNSEIQAALHMSEGLCLPHMRLCLKQAKGTTFSEALLTMQRQKMEALHQELGELIRKNDYRFAREALGAEKDSWLRAVGMVVGRAIRKM